MVRLKVSVNGEYLNTFCGDGVILSTPTGSTGYSMSAGGPIVAPKAQMILITPINPHDLNSRSIVIGAEDEVTVELAARRHQKDETAEVSFDGDHAKKLEVGDRVVIRKASRLRASAASAMRAFWRYWEGKCVPIPRLPA